MRRHQTYPKPVTRLEQLGAAFAATVSLAVMLILGIPMENGTLMVASVVGLVGAGLMINPYSKLAMKLFFIFVAAVLVVVGLIQQHYR